VSFDTYSEFKAAPSSEKITLATLDAAKRLVAWTVYSGSIYKKTSQSFAVIVSLKQSGVALTQVYSYAALVAGTYYNDRDNSIIYIWLLDSSTPNGKFIHFVHRLFFASSPIDLPWDLSTGFDVNWEPCIESTSKFGVEMDTIDQQSQAIEGSGSLTLLNNQSYWSVNFDKLFFDNQNCSIYSHNRSLPVTQARTLFKGNIESKRYSATKIVFNLKDLLANLRGVPTIANIEALVDGGYRPLPSMYQAKQRMIFGRVSGFMPTNIDNVIDSKYPLTGTIAVTNASATVTGTSTVFLTQLSPGDSLSISSSTYTIATISSDTSLTLTEVFGGTTASGLAVDLYPDGRKRYINRSWCLSGHVLSQPVPTTLNGSSISRLILTSTAGIFAGDWIYVGTLGSGTLTKVSSVSNSSILSLTTTLGSAPTIGTVVTRPCVQNLRIDKTELLFYRDWTVNPDTGILTLRDTAEEVPSETRRSRSQATFTNASRTVTGTGTSFTSLFYAGYLIRPLGTSTWHEILEVVDDVTMTLRTAFATGTETDYVEYKSLIFDPSVNTLSCDIYGRTLLGTSTSTLLNTATSIIEQLLYDAGLDSNTDFDLFDTAASFTMEKIGLVIPSSQKSRVLPTFRDIINNINKSVFGVLYQTNNFLLGYSVLRPSVPTTLVRIEESDILDITISNTNKNMAKTVKVNYDVKELDYSSNSESSLQTTSTSDISNYITGTLRERIIDSLLTSEADAQRLADRWAFLLEFSTSTIVLKTKLNFADIEINDIIDVNHRKLFERFGGTSSRKLLAVQRISKSGNEIEIEAVDLSNAFNRIAMISNTATTWAESTEDVRIYSGFITDSYGLIDSDETSFYTNLIW